MTLLNPLGLLGLGLVVPVILLHILRPRRSELIVGSTLLWSQLEKPVSAASPWQRLRFSWSLLLQLLAVILLSLALANPARASAAVLADHTVFIVDASASMSAKDGSSSTGVRLDAAKLRVEEMLADLPVGGTASLVVAGERSEVLLSSSSDAAAIKRALGTIDESVVHPDWLSAFSLAESLEVPGEDIGFVLVSDGGLTEAEQALIPTGSRFESIGKPTANVALASLSASSRGSGLIARSSIRNFGSEEVVVPIRIDVDAKTGAKARVPVPAGESVPVDLEVPSGSQVAAFLDIADGLESDNHRVALAEVKKELKVALTGVENPAITAVFNSLPGVSAAWEPATDGKGADLVVFNEVDPPAALAAPALVIAAPNGVPGASVVGSVTEPAITLVQVDDPLLVGVDFTNTGIGVSQKLAATTAEVLMSAEAAPLLLRSEISGREVVYLAFRLPDSNLHMQVAFPLFVDRVLSELARSRISPPEGIVGDPLPIETSAGGQVATPDGDQLEIQAGAAAPPTNAIGFWSFTSQPEGSTEPVVAQFAINADAVESEIRPVGAIPVEERVRKFGAVAAPSYRSLRSWFIGAVLLVVVLEWLVARRRVGVPKRQWRVSEGFRLAAIAALVLGILGFALQRGSNRVATLFLVDRSASIGANARLEQLDWIGSALGEQREDTLAGVAVFGGDARLDSTIRSDLKIDTISTRINESHTNLAAAIRLASAVLPADAKRRIVVLSDGRETDGDARAEVERLADSGIEVDVVPLERAAGADVAVESIEAPSKAAQGDRVVIAAVVQSSQAIDEATVGLFLGDTPVDTKTMPLVKGPQRVEFDAVIPEGEDLARYEVRVDAPGDLVRDNDQGYAAVQVVGPSKVAVIEGSPGVGASLATALVAGGLVVDTVPVASKFDEDALAAYQSIVLADVDVHALTEAQLDALTVVTRDLGRGLVAAGGTHSYALGGYRDTKLEELLPVISDVLDKKRRVTVSQVLAIDTSGSMGACHCGQNGNGMNSGGGGNGLFEGGANKTDISRAGALRSVDSLSPEDSVGILGVDNNQKWIADITNIGSGGDAIREAIDGLGHTTDGTDLTGTLTTAAKELRKQKSGLKHVILFTDGFTGDTVLRNLAEEAAELKKDGMSVSVLSTGETPSGDLLEAIAEAGGGRYYPGTNLQKVPEIMAQETVLASRNFINEGNFLPEVTSNAAVVRDLTASPEILGYVATTAKPTASTLLRIGPERDPLLATWQNGLGRSTAWTSDISARWSKKWASWDGYVGFWTNVVKDTMPAGDDELSVTTKVVGNELQISLDSVDAFGDGSTAIAKVSGPGVDGVEVQLRREGETGFVGSIPASEAGTYRVGVSVAADGETPAVISSIANRFYPAEFKTITANPEFLTQLSSLSGGRGVIEPSQAFDSADLESGRRASNMSAMWILFAMLAWLTAIVLGRLTIRRSAFAPVEAAGTSAVRRLRRSAPGLPGRPRANRADGPSSGSPPGTGSGPSAPSSTQPSDADGAAPPSPSTYRSGGTVGSLLDAKRRRSEGGSHRE